MTDYFTSVLSQARFGAEKPGKVDLFRGGRLFAGLNCFEPGQAQPLHTHAGADKFYFLVTGKARMAVGSDIREATAGDLVWAPAGVPHGVVAALEPTIMLVAIAPAPA